MANGRHHLGGGTVAPVWEWIEEVPKYLNELANKWDITVYSMNPLTFATCVYEATSSRYGDVIIKLHSPSGRYNSEVEYYRLSKNNPRMAKLIDYDPEYRALLIQKVAPGIQVKFEEDDERLARLYDGFNDGMIDAELVNEGLGIPTFMDEFYESERLARKYAFRTEFRGKMTGLAIRLWEEYFASQRRYFLHRDLHRRNILLAKDGELSAIDPLGVIAPKEFEFTIAPIIEAKAASDNAVGKYHEVLRFFEKYCDKTLLCVASFITWVHKMNEYVFTKCDNYEQASWAAQMIQELFFKGDACEKSDVDYHALFLANNITDVSADFF